MNLAAAFERVDAFGGGGELIAVEIGGALLKFGEVLDGLERALGAKETLNIHAAEAGSIDAAPVCLRANIADEMGGGGGVAVGVAIEAGDALHAVGPVGLAIGGGVELLLRKLRDEQTKAFEVLGIENAAEDFLKIGDRDELPLRDIAEIRTRGEKNRGWKFGEEMIGNIEIEIETGQA